MSRTTLLSSGAYLTSDRTEESCNSSVKDEKRERSFLSKKESFLFLFALIYANLTESACYSLIAPFFPKVAEEKGASATVYGFIFGILEVVIVLTSPLFGKMIAYVSPNHLMKSGIFVAGLTMILFGFLTYVPAGLPFISIAFALRILDGIGVSANLTASYASMTEKFSERLALVFGILEVAFSLGSTLGPTLGGFLFELGGFQLPFLILGSFLMLGTLINHLFAPKIEVPSSRSPVSLLKFLADYETCVCLLGISLAFFDIGIINVMLEPHLRRFQIKPVSLGLVFVVVGLCYSLASPIWGRILDLKVSPKLISLLCCPITATGAILLGPLPILSIEQQIWLIVMSLALISVGEAGRSLSYFIQMRSDAVRRRGLPESIETYGLITSLFVSCTSLGLATGPSLAGIIMDHVGIKWTPVLMLTATIFLFFLGLISVICPATRSSDLDTVRKDVETRPLI